MIPGDQWFNVATSAFAGLCAIAFVVVYATRAPWRTNAVGRQIMLLCASMAFVLLYSALIVFVPEAARNPFRTGRGILVMVVGLLLLRQARMVWTINKQFKKAGA